MCLIRAENSAETPWNIMEAMKYHGLLQGEYQYWTLR